MKKRLYQATTNKLPPLSVSTDNAVQDDTTVDQGESTGSGQETMETAQGERTGLGQEAMETAQDETTGPRTRKHGNNSR